MHMRGWEKRGKATGGERQLVSRRPEGLHQCHMLVKAIDVGDADDDQQHLRSPDGENLRNFTSV